MMKLFEINVHREIKDSNYNSVVAVMSMIAFMGIIAASIVGIVFYRPVRKSGLKVKKKK